MAQENAWYDRMDVIKKKKNGITLIELGMDYFLTPQRRSAGSTRGYCTSRDAYCVWATHTGNVHEVCRSVLHCKPLRIQASEWVRVNKVLQGSCKILYCMWRRYRAPPDAGDCMICVGDKLEIWRGKKNYDWEVLAWNLWTVMDKKYEANTGPWSITTCPTQDAWRVTKKWLESVDCDEVNFQTKDPSISFLSPLSPRGGQRDGVRPLSKIWKHKFNPSYSLF